MAQQQDNSLLQLPPILQDTPVLSRFITPLQLKVPRCRKGEKRVKTQERKVYSNAHAYHINGIDITSNNECFISSDDLRLNYWDFERPDEVYNVVDIKPDNMENLAEVITGCASHPTESNLFIYSSSRGTIKYNDLRQKSNCDSSCKTFQEKSDLYKNWVNSTAQVQGSGFNAFFQQNSSFFSEVLATISDISFTSNGRYIISRDYLTVKIWDVNKENQPVQVIDFLDHLKPEIKALYANENIFDKFEVSCNSSGSLIGTGTYNNCFYVFDQEARSTSCINVLQSEESQDVVHYFSENGERGDINNIQPELSQSMNQTENLIGLSQTDGPPLGNIPIKVEDRFPEHKEKALHISMHPSMYCLAVAVENNLYIYGSS